MAGAALSESCDGMKPEGLPIFLSLLLSTIRVPVSRFILAHADKILTAGKFDLPFGFGGHAIAGCGTIPPGAHGPQNVAVARRAGALKNQRTMHPAVSTDDEADFDHEPCACRSQQRIRRSEGLRRACSLAPSSRAHMGNVSKFGGAPGGLPDQMLALGDDTLSWRIRSNLHGSGAGSGNGEDQKPRPVAKHLIGLCTHWDRSRMP